MPRLIVEYPDDMTPVLALTYILRTVQQGRISESSGNPHFCWVTTFTPEFSKRKKVVVYTRRKKSEKAADSFLVVEADSFLVVEKETDDERSDL